MRFLFLLIISFLVSTTTAFSQVDSLQQKSYKELYDLTDGFRHPNTMGILDYFLTKATKVADKKKVVQGYSNLAEANIWNRNFKKADVFVVKLDSLSTDKDYATEQMKANYRIGLAYFYQGIWGTSIERLQKSLEIAEQEDDIVIQISLLNQIGYVKSVVGDYKNALRLQNRSNILIEVNQNNSKIDSIQLQSLTQFNSYHLSMSYFLQKKADSALYFINRALSYANAPQDSCQKKSYLRVKGEIFTLQKEFKKAKSNFDKALRICQPLTKQDSLMFYMGFGQLSMAQEKYDTAINYLEDAIANYGVKEEEEGFMMDTYKLLAKAHKYKGNLEKSTLYLEKYIHTTEEFSKIQDTVSKTFKRQEVADFKKELQAIETDNQNQRNKFNYLLLGGSIIILGLLFFLLKFYRNKKANELKFEALLAKINTASVPSQIIDTKDEVLDEKSTNEVSEEVTQQILDGLKKLEDKEYFLKQECNSYNVAKKINTNTSYLSKVINSHYGKNFNTYINDLRINYAIVRIKNDVFFRSFSIQAIAEEVGYKSADSFTKYFKKDTGLNPSFYIKNIKNIT